MASKNLGAVIQRAISDGAFRRQLQSDPAAALRGFNLSPDEIAAVRSGDSSKLLSLGVDSRMSKAFALGATANSDATRKAMTGDLSGSTSSVNIGDNTSGAREGLASDKTAGARAAHADGKNAGAASRAGAPPARAPPAARSTPVPPPASPRRRAPRTAPSTTPTRPVRAAPRSATPPR